MSDHPEDNSALEQLRGQIDKLDRQIVELINQRAKVVVEIGRIKRNDETPIYSPARESQVLDRVLAANQGPLSARCIEGIYRELMSGSFAIEQPLRIGYLGPPGSHSHRAAQAHFGSSVDYEDLRAIDGVFTEVLRGHVDYGLVPIENSTGGGVLETLDAFNSNRGEVFAYAEVQATIRHCLLTNAPPSEVHTIYSKPEVFAQCRRWVQTQYPQAMLVDAPSSSQAARIVHDAFAQDPKCGLAAIGSSLAGELYGLYPLFESIEDDPSNLTRFLVIGKQKADRTGDDKTSLVFRTEKQVGALVRVLQAFSEAGINLSHIDKRPNGRENWSYTFFVDAQGHIDDPKLGAALKIAAQNCEEVAILGSYPISRQVL